MKFASAMLVDLAGYTWQRQKRAKRGRKGDELRPMVVEQGPVAEAVATKRQTARVGVPQSKSEGAKASRHPRIPPALVHAAQQFRIRYLRKLGQGKSKCAAEFLAIVEPGQRREQHASVAAGRSVGVAGAAGMRPQHEQRTVKATRYRASAT